MSTDDQLLRASTGAEKVVPEDDGVLAHAMVTISIGK